MELIIGTDEPDRHEKDDYDTENLCDIFFAHKN